MFILEFVKRLAEPLNSVAFIRDPDRCVSSYLPNLITTNAFSNLFLATLLEDTYAFRLHGT